MEDKDYGTVRLTVASRFAESKMSKNKLLHTAALEWRQLEGYLDNSITRYDAAVLARLCYAFNCTISDLLEFVPAK